MTPTDRALAELQRNWNGFGHRDPLWAILTAPGKRGNRWEPDEFFASGVRDVAQALAAVAALGLRPGRTRALDFGCGVGRLTQALAGHFAEVVGVDIAPSMIELAERVNRHPGRCRYRVNAAADLAAFPEGHFDLVYSDITLQHMRPVYATGYIAEFVRVLAPGGVAVFTLPSQEARRPPSFKARVLARAPARLAAAYRRWRYGGVMECYAVPRAEVEAVVVAAGGLVADVAEQPNRQGWLNCRYVVTGSGRPGGVMPGPGGGGR